NKSKRLSFAGITMDLKVKNSLTEDNPFFNIEKKVVEKDQDDIKNLIYKYNKNANDLAKIIYIKEL
ncbi:MAG: hypothetical protein AB1782_04945, partial [Cyanobacteriota bacterium]